MIRDAVASDLDAIVEIYNAAIPGRLATAEARDHPGREDRLRPRRR